MKTASSILTIYQSRKALSLVFFLQNPKKMTPHYFVELFIRLSFSMEYLSLQEKIEMVLIYGECGRNMQNSLTMYNQRYPDKVRSRCSFYRVIQQFTSDGSVRRKQRTREATVIQDSNQVDVLASVSNNPHVSTRAIAHDTGISQTSVCKILKRHKYHPYHVSLHQELHGDDFQNRVRFCRWARERMSINQNFFSTVLFSDESSFTNHGTVNRHNMHYWSVENPHWLRHVEHQRPWTVNVWCGLIGENLIGPYIIEGNLNGQKYSEFLEGVLPTLLEDLSLEVRRTMWFQHDGCPAHYSLLAREVLDRNFNGRWIGRGSLINWPARSPDLTSPDFFLWGYLKSKVYQQEPTTREDMIERIKTACAQIGRNTISSCVSSFEKRVEKCIEVEGYHFEHLIK